jgi:hypothetical protein
MEVHHAFRRFIHVHAMALQITVIDFIEEIWCCRVGLNHRPHPYQGCALPLSYGSMTMKTLDVSAFEPKRRVRRPVGGLLP